MDRSPNPQALKDVTANRRPPTGPRSARRLAAAILLSLLALVTIPRTAASQNAPEPAADPLSSVYELGSRLMDEGEAPDTRADAARDLLDRDGRDATQVLLRAFEADAPPGAMQAALVAFSERPLEPAFEAPLRRAIGFAAEDDLPLLLQCLSMSQARDAVGATLTLISPDNPDAVRLAAFDALARQTGRVDIPRDDEAWMGWWEEVRWISEADWRARLASNHARQAERLRAAREDVLSRLVQTLGRLHAQTPPEQRSALLASMIRDDLREVRALGLDLASRALLNAQRLDDDVAAAALERLSDADVDTRIAAARLIENMSPAQGVGRVIEALASENDARIAGPLLRLIAAHPNPIVASDALRWLAVDSPARQAAAQALLALHGIGALPRDVADDARRSLRDVAPEAMQPSTLRLLGALGDERDRETLASLLDHDDRATRLAAADGLVAHPAGLDVVLDAAREDPELLDACVRGVLTHRPDAYGFSAVYAVAQPGSQRGDAAIGRLIAAIPLAALAEAAEELDDPKTREAFISRVLSARSIDQDPAGAASILCSLARCRLDGGSPEGALTALDQAAQIGDTPQNSHLTDLRLASLVALGRFSDADELDRSAEDWIIAAESLPSLTDPQGLAAAFRARFELDPALSERLDQLLGTHEQVTTPDQSSPD